MTAVGYALSSEEHGAIDLVRHARRAEEAGFSFTLISDHCHSSIGRDGRSPFAWSVLGAIAQATETLRVGTGLTCPTTRIDPAIIAQASATAASLMPGRFFLGLGTGAREAEHVLGTPWTDRDVRAGRQEETVGVIRESWASLALTPRGHHSSAAHARIHSVPDLPPPIYVAAGGVTSAREAARLGDGLIGTRPDRALVDAFAEASGHGPRIGQVTVCWAPSEAEARRTARDSWPMGEIHGASIQEPPRPPHFERSTGSMSEDRVADVVPCGPDPERHLARIAEYVDAGYDHIYLHQVGRDQTGFIKFAEGELLPALKPKPLRLAS